MRHPSQLVALVAISLAAALSYLTAILVVQIIEKRARIEITQVLQGEGIDWAGVEPDGVLVRLYGTAPSEAERFRALSATGTIVDAARVIDEMEVTASQPILAPRFSMELLRNDSGVSLVGLVPKAENREALTTAVQNAVGGAGVTDLLEAADFPAPENWDSALAFGMKALEMLPRSKISIAADQIAVTAITDSAKEKQRLEKELRRATPKGIELTLDISAPRPVITPFTLRFVIDEGGPRFDACSADTEKARDRILKAAAEAGLSGGAECTVGLGVPSPQWAAAVETGVKALAELGGGTLTFSDADVTLVALEDTDQGLFDRVVGETETALPKVFSLHAVKPEPEKITTSDDPNAVPEFQATLSPEGLVQLRGRVPDDLVRSATESYAHARFGRDNVYAAMRLDEALPDGWPMRVLVSLEALSALSNGAVIMRPGIVELRGTTHEADANARLSQLFADKLGEAQDFKISVEYVEPEQTEEYRPTPAQCAASIENILADQKISFAPSSTDIEGPSLQVIDRIAQVLRDCPDVRMEIGGHTDSQGREEMNQQLSQRRAESVMNALLARRILTGNLTAKGYGETQPIADNDTEEGREANRRIEFRLLEPDTPDEQAPADETSAPDTQTPATEAPQTEAEAADEQN